VATAPDRPWWITPLLGFGALFAAALALWWWTTSPHGQMERDARHALAAVLLDATSADLRNLRRTETGGVCGEVNAKNALGAYTGFKPFHASGDVVFVEQNEAGGFAASMVRASCGA
jgi:hypothetical protein